MLSRKKVKSKLMQAHLELEVGVLPTRHLMLVHI